MFVASKPVQSSPPKLAEEKKDDEREVWEFMTPLAWHNAVTEDGSIFKETYEATRKQIVDTAERCGYDVIVEVGVGTGDIIGPMETSVPRIGLDINQDFIKFCKENQGSEHCEFHVADALHLMDWWKAHGFDTQYKKPLVICVNNTLNIMPEHLRGGVIDQMLALAGTEGICVVTYWNGNFFSHAIMNFYKKNEPLCGKFEQLKHVDWDHRVLLTPTNYSTEWHIPVEVQQLLRAYDVDVPNIEDSPKYGAPHVNCDGLSIFVWFDQTSTSRAKGYYDSEDAQKFYNHIWGEDNLHVGRYDLLQGEELQMPTHQQISLAQERHEIEFIELVKDLAHYENYGLRIADFGCGFGGLLRRFHKEGLVWHATGVDISSRMCHQSRLLNTRHNCDEVIDIKEESYLDVSLPDESCDLVISMDALLHVGPERQRRAVAEAARLLRPGGWMIFSDIMQKDNVDPEEMQPIYERIHLSKMGSVQNYREAFEECGFSKFVANLHSDNITTHYASVLEVMQEKGPEIGLSAEYMEKSGKGLETWKTLAPKNIDWGFLAAQKTTKVPLRSVQKKIGA